MTNQITSGSILSIKIFINDFILYHMQRFCAGDNNHYTFKVRICIHENSKFVALHFQIQFFSPTKVKTLAKCTTVKVHNIQAYRLFNKKQREKNNYHS